MFIVVEGIDGCGKTTVVNELKRILEEKGYRVYVTKEPFNPKIRNVIKDIIREEHEQNEVVGRALSLLFAADRYLHQIDILEKLSKGYVVISDRYYHSSYAYQTTYEGITLEYLKYINSSLKKPDYVFILDVPVDIAIARLSERKETTSYEKKDFLRKVRDNYLKLREELKDEKIYIIDNNRELRETIKEILSILGL